ncbi:beta-propeller domain-containing protein [Paractinoplanes brasiliensis]|uniref:Beta propeller domain-containing protein n=1 Tax=Paractinoplanes brasiliensis TaxID=52695 RepID=A0A4R6JSJ2_9ACTN|nr:beta-propeller domain-containing protein [Actinoplanes brasiliensis]TDO39574.1 beta propeller domain-containing protein [Actinoplanes brasiliensis]
MSRRSWLWSALAVLPLAGCTASTPASPPSSPAPPLRLVAFDSCAQLEKELRAAAELSSTAEQGGARLAVPDNARAADAGAAPGQAAPAHSSTNVHEAGVDEPDIVKTDGRRIVTITGGVLRVVDTASRAQTGKLALGLKAYGEPTLLLAGNRALVLADGGGGPMLREDTRIIRPAEGRSELLLIDLSSVQPRLISRYRGDGRIIDARQQGSTAHVVIGSGPDFQRPFRGDTVPENVMQDDRNTIKATPLDAWLPDWEITTGGRTTKGQLDCAAVSRPDSFSGLRMLRVLTFDLNAAELGAGDPVAMVADGDTVYGTDDSLYIANNETWRFNTAASGTSRIAPPDGTNIYRFSLPPVGKPAYVASGKVPGRLLNQYSMSEWEGHLRVATTSWADDASAVRVLRERNGKLTEVGVAEGLGKGERIYSVRFIGPRGYVVTFRQTDPLYSLDLSDPEKPRVTGELKITGYSSHLQAAGENRLIGIGQEADAQGRPQGVQVSLFDVSDPAAPKRLDQHVVAGGQSEAEADPHAILWWPATNLLVMPVADAKADGALALRVTGDRLRDVTRLAPAVASAGPMRRAVVVEDVLWSITGEGLLATDTSTLDRVAWVDMR